MEYHQATGTLSAHFRNMVRAPPSPCPSAHPVSCPLVPPSAPCPPRGHPLCCHPCCVRRSCPQLSCAPLPCARPSCPQLSPVSPNCPPVPPVLTPRVPAVPEADQALRPPRCGVGDGGEVHHPLRVAVQRWWQRAGLPGEGKATSELQGHRAHAVGPGWGYGAAAVPHVPSHLSPVPSSFLLADAVPARGGDRARQPGQQRHGHRALGQRLCGACECHHPSGGDQRGSVSPRGAAGGSRARLVGPRSGLDGGRGRRFVLTLRCVPPPRAASPSRCPIKCSGRSSARRST